MADVENVGAELSFAEAQAEWIARNNPEASSDTTAESTDTADAADEHAGAKPKDETADESATSDDHSEDEHEEDEHGDNQPNKKKGGFQRRIEKLNAKIAERDRQIAELAAKTAGAKTDTTEKTATADAGDPEPEAKDDESAAEFLKRYAKWQVRQDLKAERAATEKATREAETVKQQKTAKEAWDAKEAKAIEKLADADKDYEEATTDFVKRAQAGQVRVSQVMKDFVNDSEFGPQMLYAISTMDAAKVNEIAAMGTAAAARALTTIEAQFAPEKDSTAAEKPAVTTKAPPPVTPVRRPAPAASAEPSDKDDTDTWLRKRNAQIARERGGR